jgi:hypothetical protein
VNDKQAGSRDFFARAEPAYRVLRYQAALRMSRLAIACLHAKRQTPNDLMPEQYDYAKKAWLAQQI